MVVLRYFFALGYIFLFGIYGFAGTFQIHSADNFAIYGSANLNYLNKVFKKKAPQLAPVILEDIFGKRSGIVSIVYFDYHDTSLKNLHPKTKGAYREMIIMVAAQEKMSPNKPLVFYSIAEFMAAVSNSAKSNYGFLMLDLVLDSITTKEPDIKVVKTAVWDGRIQGGFPKSCRISPKDVGNIRKTKDSSGYITVSMAINKPKSHYTSNPSSPGKNFLEYYGTAAFSFSYHCYSIYIPAWPFVNFNVYTTASKKLIKMKSYQKAFWKSRLIFGFTKFKILKQQGYWKSFLERAKFAPKWIVEGIGINGKLEISD